MDGYYFWDLVKQKASLRFCVMMAVFTEIFILSDNSLHWCKLGYGPFQGLDFHSGIRRDCKTENIFYILHQCHQSQSWILTKILTKIELVMLTHYGDVSSHCLPFHRQEEMVNLPKEVTALESGDILTLSFSHLTQDQAMWNYTY